MGLMKKGENQEYLVDGAAVETHTVLGNQAEFEGKLIFQGAVRIDGKFRGEVVTNGLLVIGENAEVDAQVAVGTMIVQGIFRGSAKAAESIELKAPGKFYGNLISPKLVVEQGVIFDGSSKMENLERTVTTKGERNED